MFETRQLFEVLRRPIMTEKSTTLRESQQKVLVEAATWATKGQIVDAAKLMFNVEVTGVNTLNCRGKIKRVGKHMGKQANYKKAYLTLKSGSDVDLFGFIGQETSKQ
jgi:large subunit ribosomal protein L23